MCVPRAPVWWGASYSLEYSLNSFAMSTKPKEPSILKLISWYLNLSHLLKINHSCHSSHSFIYLQFLSPSVCQAQCTRQGRYRQKPHTILKIKRLLGKWEETERPDQELVQATLKDKEGCIGFLQGRDRKGCSEKWRCGGQTSHGRWAGAYWEMEKRQLEWGSWIEGGATGVKWHNRPLQLTATVYFKNNH